MKMGMCMWLSGFTTQCPGEVRSLDMPLIIIILVSPRIPHQKMFSSECVPNYQLRLESAVAIMLRFQLCSAHYIALQTKNNVKIASAISPVTTENTDDFHLKHTVWGSLASHYHKSTPWAVSKKKWDTKGGQR